MTGNQMKRKMAAMLCMALMGGCTSVAALAEGLREASPGEAPAETVIAQQVEQSTLPTENTTQEPVIEGVEQADPPKALLDQQQSMIEKAPENLTAGNQTDEETDEQTQEEPEAPEYAEFEMTYGVNDGVITVYITGASDGKMIDITVSGNGVNEFNGILCTNGKGQGELGKLNEEEECFEALDPGVYEVAAYYAGMESIKRTAKVTIESAADAETTTPPPSDAETTTPPPSDGETVNAFTILPVVSEGTISVVIDGASDREIEVEVLDASGNALAKESLIGSGLVQMSGFAVGTYTVRAHYVTPVQNADGSYDDKTVTTKAEVTKSSAQAPEQVTPIDIKAKVEVGKDYIIVTVTEANDAEMFVALGGFDPKTIQKGGSVRFDGLEAGKRYELEVDYYDVIKGVSPYRDTVEIPKPVVLGAIKIAAVTPGTNVLSVSGTATAGQQIIITTTPAAAADVYAVADDNGVFSAQIGCAAGTYTAVTAKYVLDSAIAHTASGSWTVAAPAQKPPLAVDAVNATSTTVVGKTTAGIVVEIKTSDYSQKVTADENGIVRFSLPHTYGAGAKMTLVVYYGDNQSFSQELTVGEAVYMGTLQYGDVGGAVETLTARLEELGYPVEETTRYGSTVREAVRLFQRANGLDDDGIAGKKTQQALFSVSAIAYGSDKYPTLVRGDRDMDLIYTLQQRLKDLGYYTIKVDGIFGSGTQRAVRLFQQVNGLSVTGKADNATQTLLYSSSAKPASYGVTGDYKTLSRSGKYKSAVVPLQRRLKALGYYSGNIDGYFGSQTYRAVRSFQSRNGLTVTGVADPYTQEVLYSSSAMKASSSSSSSSSSSTGYRLLYWGCRGDSVKRLQQALIDAGYKSIVRTADGIFGQWTYDAVKAYQKDHSLAVDGIAGKNTQNSLYGTSY